MFSVNFLPSMLSIKALITATADHILIFCLVFFKENKAQYFMWIVWSGTILLSDLRVKAKHIKET